MEEINGILRPNGKVYRPQITEAHPVWKDEEMSGAVVLGTHLIAASFSLALRLVQRECGWDYGPVSPARGWARLAVRRGEPFWVEDEMRGRACVWWQEIEELR